MKRYLSKFDLSLEFVKYSVYDCLDGTTNGKQRFTRFDTSCLFAEYVEKLFSYNKKYVITSKHKLEERIREIAREDRTKLYFLVDYLSEQLYTEIKERKINLLPIRYDNRLDGHSKKIRRIGIASMKQQCYDYIAVDACKEMFLAKIGHHQCASLKNKGQLFGKNAIETWIRTNPNKCKWVFKCDIKKFYPSVNHDIIKGYLDRDIKNDDVKYLIFSLIDSYDEGLCIGSYLCQYLANYLLSYAYHYVTEMLYTERRGKRQNLIHHALFYMDDIILFGSSKKNVKKASKLLEEFLNNKLGLTLKPSYQLFPLDSRPIDMMGYKIYTYKTTVRKRIFDRANKVFLKLKNPKNEMSLGDAYKVVSYYGYFKHSFSKKYTRKVKLNKTLKKAKEVISNATKKSNI
ncbi:MAG: hypothetical protein IJ068_06875 [Bacilli bacterium]|nr:hypothetical protein [Bacilli bacterium]